MSQDPARPAPRTRDEDWMSREEWLRRHQALRSAARGADCGLLWLGDSITEAWPTVGAAAWERVFAPRRALALGLGGDQTQHLLWRLQQGEAEGLDPRQAFLLIGVNNLGQEGQAPQEVAAGVLACAADLRARFPRARLTVLGLLPFGREPQDPRRLAVADVNRRLAQALGPGPARFHDSGAVFLAPDGRIDPALMPDELHPSAEGYGRWAEELVPLFG